MKRNYFLFYGYFINLLYDKLILLITVGKPKTESTLAVIKAADIVICTIQQKFVKDIIRNTKRFVKNCNTYSIYICIVENSNTKHGPSNLSYILRSLIDPKLLSDIARNKMLFH